VDPLGPPVRLLQMNLCNSGIAGCFTGRAVTEGAALIRAEVPDVVTLNEVCRGDVAELERALDEATSGGTASGEFQPARDRRTGMPYACRDGTDFGNAVLSRTSSRLASSGVHPVQDPDDPEERSWLCLDVPAELRENSGPVLTVCTTHPAYTDPDVALAQCRHTVDSVADDLKARPEARPVVVAGDLNLAPGPDLASCLPTDAAVVADDGGTQHVVLRTPADVDTRTVDLNGSTDHPALVATVRW
jgi:endonuclease/exonuclease/phosphatase family metal-dependent hydrolase